MMTRYLKQDHEKGMNVYANYGLKFSHEKLDVKKLLDSSIDLQNVSVGIDEMTVFADCRRSMKNLMITYFVLQTRKRNVNLYYTTQDFDMVDLRLNNHTHIKIICEKIDETDDPDAPLTDYRRYTIFDIRNRRNIKPISFILNIQPFYRMYDTNEIILPPM